MVVIKKNLRDFERNFGRNVSSDLRAYADIIGYTLEEEGGELRIELNPDRPDLLSFPTLIRSSGNFEDPEEFSEYGYDTKAALHLSDKGLKLRPYVFAFTARGKPIGTLFDDLIDFQEKIHLTAGKNRKKSSVGIHDMDRISLPARFESARTDTLRFTTYDGTVTGTAEEILVSHQKGKEYGHLSGSGKEVSVILDSEGDVMSMPPVINGRKSMISSDTSDFFVDITGTDLNVCISTMFLMMNFFKALGYKVGIAKITPEKNSHRKDIENAQKRSIGITDREVREFIGIPVKIENIISVLRKMGYRVRNSGFPIDVQVPPYRIDVMGPADILEDLAKGIGYENIEPRPIALNTMGERNGKVEFSNTLRSILIGAGFQEVLTFVIGSESKYRNISYAGAVKVLNPKSLDFSVVRDRLSLNLLELHQNNRSRTYPQNLFEIGEVIDGGNQAGRIAISLAASRASFSEIKRVVDYLFKRLLGIQAKPVSWSSEMFIEGRSALIEADNEELGKMGEIKPELLEQFSLKVPVAVAELELDKLYSLFHSKH